MRFDKETIAIIIKSMIYSIMTIGASFGFVFMVMYRPLLTFITIVVMTVINSFTLIIERKQKEAKNIEALEYFSKMLLTNGEQRNLINSVEKESVWTEKRRYLKD